MGTANASLFFAQGLNGAFTETYRSFGALNDPLLNMVMHRSHPSAGAAEDYPYYLSVPHPARQDKGDDITHKGFSARRFRVVNKKWSMAVDWHADDEDDDQLNQLKPWAASAGENFAMLDERVFFQILTGSSDSELLSAVPNAGDGSALFATTAGGSARFGASGGNLTTGVTLTTAADVRTAVWNAVEQMQRFQDTEGQPLYPSDYVLRKGIVIIFNVQSYELFAEAFLQSTTLDLGASFGGAGVQNTIQAAGLNVTLWPTQRVTNTNIFIGIRNPRVKAIFKQTRRPLYNNVAEFGNSDQVRETEIKSLYWRERAGYGVCGEPYQFMKVTG